MTRTLTPEHAQRRARLPRRLALLMRPELPSLSQEIIEEVRRSIPEYGRPCGTRTWRRCGSGSSAP